MITWKIYIIHLTEYPEIVLYAGATTLEGNELENYLGSGSNVKPNDDPIIAAHRWGPMRQLLKKYGLITKQIIWKGNDRVKANLVEAAAVRYFHVHWSKGGYVIDENGGTNPGSRRSEFTKQKMRDALHRPETILKMSKAKKGVPKSEETKQKISKAHLGKHHLPETRLKISKARMGVPISEETKQKIRDAHLGKHHLPETILKMRKPKSEETKHPAS